LEYEFYFSIYWEQSSQLTFAPSFFRGVGQPPTRFYVIGFTTNQRVTNCCRTGFGELFHLWLGQAALGANCQSRRALHRQAAGCGMMWGKGVKQWGCHAAKILRKYVLQYVSKTFSMLFFMGFDGIINDL
jgi:hypothetical protein